MTCIVGLKHDGVIYLGGDGIGAGGSSKTTVLVPKVFKVDDFIIGYTTSFRMGQLLQYNFKPPNIEGLELNRYMVSKFIPAIREAFKAGGFSSEKERVESAGEFLVGVKGQLFKVQSDYSVLESADSYDACGSGEAYALGSLFSTHTTTPNQPKYRVNTALAAASYHSSYVGYPFTVVKTEIK